MAGPGARRQTTTIRLLGGFEVERAGRIVSPSAWRLRKAADLVKLLALAPGHRLQRDQAMEALWPDKDPDAAANNLYQAIHGARAALGRDEAALRVDLHDGVLSLAPVERLAVDVEQFDNALRRADGGDVTARLEARTLYRGDLLPDDVYEEWSAPARAAAAASHRRNLAELARLREAEGEQGGALDALRDLLALDPTDETQARRVMVLEARAGRRGAAQRQYELLRDTLRRELDIEPSAETTRLALDIVEGRLDPLGEQSALSNLPAQFTSFVGRQRELRETQRLLLAARLLTLTGTGGTGKTRLALEAAHAARTVYPDGAWLVELAAVRSADGVARAVADTFGVREAPGLTLDELLVGQLGSRRLLLVLDNCEHLVDACDALCRPLLAGCPNLRILATSRQPLRTPGEQVFRVPSLPVPDPLESLPPSELGFIDSVRLFSDRAQSADPTFAIDADNAAAVARLCFHLDGLPLAIELAASRSATVPVGELVERLSQRFDLLVGGDRPALTRQQTLRATIDWSYDLLTPAQQRVLRQMSVFSGRTSLDAAEAVCLVDGMTSADLLSILRELVDQSLLVLDAAGPPRFGMLDTIRDYANERLIRAGELPAAERAQIAWAVQLTTTAAAERPTDRWADGLRRLSLEHDSLRAALERAIRTQPRSALQLVDNLWSFWLWDGHLVEGRAWLERTLVAVREPDAARAEALFGLGAIIGRLGDPIVHAQTAHAAVETLRGLGDVAGTCRALALEGCAWWVIDDLDHATEVFGSALRVAEEAHFESGRGAALNCLAVVHLYAGEAQAARQLLDDALAAFRAAGAADPVTVQVLDLGELVLDEPATGGRRLVFEETFGSFRDVPAPTAAAYALGNRGMLARINGEFEQAASDFSASLAAFHGLNDERGMAQALGRLGNLIARSGDAARARRLLTECLEIRRRLGDSRGVSLAEASLGNLETLNRRYDRAEELLGRAAAAFRRRSDGWGLASTLANLASLALARGEPAEAMALLRESLAAARTTHRQRWIAWRLLESAAAAGVSGDLSLVAHLRAEAATILSQTGDQTGLEELRTQADRFPAAESSPDTVASR